MDWMKQAENDLAWAKHSMKGKFYSQVCFISQQSSEKALKAFCYFKGIDVVKTHSLFQIIKMLGENGELEKNSKLLDQYYMASRYPDALPAGAPFEVFTDEQAEKAILSAEFIIRTIKERLK